MPTPLPEPPRPGRRARISEVPRARLSRDRIAAAALAIVDAEGLDALSMRRVAERLGTGASTSRRCPRTASRTSPGR